VFEQPTEPFFSQRTCLRLVTGAVGRHPPRLRRRLPPADYVFGHGRFGRETLSNWRSLPIQNEQIVRPERYEAPRPSGRVQEFDFRTIGLQQFDDSPHIAHLDVWFITAVENSH
jgi:hypothetical protein